MRAIDRVLRDHIWPVAAAQGFARSGRRFFKLNANDDLVQIYFEPAFGSTDEEHLRVSMWLRQGLARRHRGIREPTLIQDDHDPTGRWEWIPPSPAPYRPDGGDPNVWNGLSWPGIGSDLGREAASVWFPTMTAVIEPGALTQELRRPTGRFPGRIRRSAAALAASLINDGGLPEPTVRLLLRQIAVDGPVWGETLRVRYEAACAADHHSVWD